MLKQNVRIKEERRGVVIEVVERKEKPESISVCGSV